MFTDPQKPISRTSFIDRISVITVAIVRKTFLEFDRLY
ncbi:hypothetical protein CKA32_001125 [Geitlerinema sp. FC II]|nr:hypothetical protein CKA32_001125 [Geitlerinema sp. FC II]